MPFTIELKSTNLILNVFEVAWSIECIKSAFYWTLVSLKELTFKLKIELKASVKVALIVVNMLLNSNTQREKICTQQSSILDVIEVLGKESNDDDDMFDLDDVESELVCLFWCRNI